MPKQLNGEFLNKKNTNDCIRYIQNHLLQFPENWMVNFQMLEQNNCFCVPYVSIAHHLHSLRKWHLQNLNIFFSVNTPTG